MYGNMAKEVLCFVETKKKMRIRLGFIKQWLKEAESDYEEDRKEEGEINLLLVQAEAKRALELSLENQPEQKKKTAFSFSRWIWGLLLVGTLAMLVCFAFLPKQTSLQDVQQQSSPEIKKTVKLQGMVLPEKVEEQKNLSPPSVVRSASTEKDRLPKKIKDVPAVVKPPVKKHLAVDMVDLVKEAEKNLYSKDKEKEVMP